MTELQMGLIGLGAAAVVGVFGYNKWQEFRQRKLAQAVLKPHHDDVLLGGAARAGEALRAEPSPQTTEPAPAEPTHSEPARSAPEIRSEPPAAVERIEPVFVDPHPTLPVEDMAAADYEDVPEVPVIDKPLEMAPVVSAPVAAPDDGMEIDAGEVPAALLDPRLEFVVAMELVEPVSSIQILQSQRSALARLLKPVHWIGFNERTREWQRLSYDNELNIRRLRVGLQLVNRLGPVSEGDLTVFTTAMQALADELMAVADMPPSRVLDQAAEIDRFCAAVDLEIGLNLVSRGSAFAGTKIRALAEAAGMVLGADGIFTRYDD